LTNGSPSDIIDGNFQINQTIIEECLEKFIKHVSEFFRI